MSTVAISIGVRFWMKLAVFVEFLLFLCYSTEKVTESNKMDTGKDAVRLTKKD